MESLLSKGGHSAQVKIQLLIGEKVIPVAQLGRDFLLLDDPFDLAPTNATLSLTIDDSHRSWPVQLPDGISASSEQVAIALAK
jgi:hypothetical protein